MVWFGRCSEPEESNVDPCCALGMFQGNQQRLQEGEGGAWSAGGSPEGGSCVGFIPTPSACPHKAQKHKRCPPGLPGRALGRAQGARGRLLALCPFGTCCPFPSECPVPSPACLLPKALRAVAEVLHREHPGLLPTAGGTVLGLLSPAPISAAALQVTSGCWIYT